MFLGLKTGGHDTTATLVDRKGDVIAAIAEERLDRVKHSDAFPERALLACLDEAGANPRDVEGVFVPYRYPLAVAGAGLLPALRYREARLRSFATLARRLDRRRREASRRLTKLGVRPAVASLDHHDCHAATAYLTSPFERATVVTVDGRGERASARIYAAAGARVKRVATAGNYPHSVGLLYSAITHHLGFTPDGAEGTTMALASYGDPDRFRPVFDRLLRYERGRLRTDVRLYANYAAPAWELSRELCRLTCPPRAPGEELLAVHADLAAALQEATLRVVCDLVADATRRAGSRDVCLAGGVALNSVANGVLAQRGLVDRLHVPSAPADDGAALGAALLGRRRAVGGGEVARPSPSPFLGRRHRRTDATIAIDRFVGADRGRRSVTRHDAIDAAVTGIVAGEIVGLFEGRAEFGPRALGQRSILADPSRPDVADLLNEQVKFREPFRPFAIAVLAEAAIQLCDGAIASPHMSMVFPVRSSARRLLAGAIHVDGTVRLQTVDRSGPPTLRRLLERFHARTGVPALVNTSMNVKGEPIVDTAEQALRCLARTDLGMLLLEGQLVSDRPAVASFRSELDRIAPIRVP